MFCAIDLPENIKFDLQQHIERLRNSKTGTASWTRPENIHLTLKFFGNVAPAMIESLSRALGQATSGVTPFTVSVGTSGSFPGRGLPKVLWVGVEDCSGKLSKLQESIERESEAHGFPREIREFHPHLTIARLRSSSGARELAGDHLKIGFPVTEFEARELILIRSELSPSGSRYSVIQRYPFKQG